MMVFNSSMALLKTIGKKYFWGSGEQITLKRFGCSVISVASVVKYRRSKR